MTFKTSLAVMTVGLILSGTAGAQTPGATTTPPGIRGRTTPGTPGSMTPGTPGSTTPGLPGSTTPSVPGSTTPGLPGGSTLGTPGRMTTPGAPGVPGSVTPDTSGPSLNPTFPCPAGQARRPGSTICSPVMGPTIPSR